MYATVTANHFALSADFAAGVHDMNGDFAVVCHVSNELYLSFTPDEARRFADAISMAAEKAVAAQARLAALSDPVPVGSEEQE